MSVSWLAELRRNCRNTDADPNSDAWSYTNSNANTGGDIDRSSLARLRIRFRRLHRANHYRHASRHHQRARDRRYTSVDGKAKQKGDYIFATGRLVFEAGETQKTFPFLINEDNYAEGPEAATIILSNPSGGTTLGVPSTATVQIADDAPEPSTNPIDDARGFVCQQYHDFLNRQSDPSGEDFWTNEITSCGANAACIDDRRTNVSAAFFLSIEFQNTGYLVIRTHKAAFGSDKSNPRYTVFLRDQREVNNGVVVGQPGADALLEQNTRSSSRSLSSVLSS